MNNRCGNLRTDAADDALRAHQPRRGNRLEQVLRNQRVHGRYASDVDDRDARARAHDLLQQVLHHDLRAFAVQGADQRERQNAVPKLDDGSGEFQHFRLLAGDRLFAILKGLGSGEES